MWYRTSPTDHILYKSMDWEEKEEKNTALTHNSQKPEKKNKIK